MVASAASQTSEVRAICIALTFQLSTTLGASSNCTRPTASQLIDPPATTCARSKAVGRVPDNGEPGGLEETLLPYAKPDAGHRWSSALHCTALHRTAPTVPLADYCDPLHAAPLVDSRASPAPAPSALAALLAGSAKLTWLQAYPLCILSSPPRPNANSYTLSSPCRAALPSGGHPFRPTPSAASVLRKSFVFLLAPRRLAAFSSGIHLPHSTLDDTPPPPSRKRPVTEADVDTSPLSLPDKESSSTFPAASAAASSSVQKRARFESPGGGPAPATNNTSLPINTESFPPHYTPLPPTKATNPRAAHPVRSNSTFGSFHSSASGTSNSNPNSPSNASSNPISRRSHASTLDPRSPPAPLVPFPAGSSSYFADSSARMFDLDESVRALYFAPTPIVVLDHNRRIRMMNRPCESIFLMTGVSCMGQTMDRLIIEKHRADFTTALNEAAQVRATAAWAPPVLTRLTFLQDDQKMFSADMNISAWHPTDEVFSETFNNHFARSLSGDAEKSVDLDNGPSPGTPQRMDSMETRASTLPHESYFTISIVPTRLAERRMSPADLETTKAEELKEGVFHTIETAIMALSADGSTVVRNRACDELLQMFQKKNPQDKPKKDTAPKKPTKDGLEVDLSWLSDVMDCYTEDFSEPFPEQNWPIYRAAILGQLTKPVRIGCVATDTGARRVYEIVAKPVRGAGGFGEHVGGVITLIDVTDTDKQRKLEVEQKGEEYFRTICDSMPQLLWTAYADGHHDWYNEGWYRYTGLNRQDSSGVGWQQVFHEDDMVETNKRWSHSLRTGEPYQTMYRCRKYDGSWKWMLGRALPLRDQNTGKIIKWYGSCTDCDNEVKALEASRKSQAQLTSVINHAHVTIWAIDRDAIITIAEGPGVRSLRLAPGTPNGSDGDGSGSGNSMSGSIPGGGAVHARSEDMKDAESQTNSQSAVSGQGKRSNQRSMIGRSIFEVWDSPGIREAISRALNGESVVQEMEIEGRWFRTQYTPQREESYEHDANEGPIIGVVGASVDITDRRRAELKLEESMHERSRALAAETAAKEASRIKSEFLANMSHEIRTPIAGVIGLSELLCDTQLTKEQRDFAENIQRSADALLTVINDILDFEKLELGKMDLEKTAFNLNVVIMDTQKMLTFATQKKGLEFRNECQLNYTGQITGDAGRLRQVLTNLLTNAIKFTATGAITLRVIETYEDPKSLHVHFEVRDTGCGISQTTLKKLFQPFSQADPSFARRFGGTGLGLSICKNLVDLMGGTIGLESVENKGSNAWFSIPFEKVHSIEAGGDSSPDEEGVSEMQMDEATSSLGVSENPLQRPRKDIWILVAEDNLINAQIALKTLKKMGFSCKVAKDGLEAVEEVGKQPYDLILMDCHMPNCDGYEATKRLRKSESVDIRTTPIIAMTASAIRGDREKCLAAGMSDYLSKPVKSAALESTLVKWLFDPSTRQSLSKYVAPPVQGDYFGAKKPGSGVLEVMIPKAGQPGSPPQLIERDSTETVMGPRSIQSGRRGSFNPIAEREAIASEIAASPSPVLASAPHPLRSSGAERSGSASLDALASEASMPASRNESDDEPTESMVAGPTLSKTSKRRLLRHGPVKVVCNDPMPTKFKPAPKTLSAPEIALADKPPIFIRRSSREQGGLGRDLEGEVVRAMEDGQDGPSLGVSMEESLEDVHAEVSQEEAGNIHVRA
ncbi:WD40 repeat protein [Moesziomyces antarcticus T-34]|uniref:histidine kinase n=1 Tax=Pseudozyma antarctica (strain T-34) TaxID=1151754 RepID=M9M461_PSEA3|nr:WD40 repeat protein [Moesziomyces antarcticus T-34]